MGEGAMIFRLSAKLNARIKAGTLASLPQDDNPFADWSAGLFLVGRSLYILLSNTRSFYSTVMSAKGVTSGRAFIECALSGIRERLQADGHEGVYECHIAPVSGSVRFARALNRSVTGSMNDLAKHAVFCLAEGNRSPLEVGTLLNKIPMSALNHDGSSYGFPRDVFAEMVSSAGSCLRKPGPQTDGDSCGQR
jgi:hypothetical protein